MRMRSLDSGRIAERLIRYLPRHSRARAQHAVRRRRLERLLRDRLGAKYTPVDEGPAPPPELVAQTSVLYERDLPAATDRYGYLAGGYLGVLTVLGTVERFGFDIAEAEAVLDFGCGAAKNIRLLRGVRGLRVVGTDVSGAQIEWAREHVPGVEFHVNGLEPPLTFAADDSFDLVTAASVFTHIPLDLQRPWLEEIRRVLRPGGYFFCTVAGAYHIDVQLSTELREQLRTAGQVTLAADDPGVSHGTRAAGSWDVFQTREEVRRSFGSAFEILHYTETTMERAQDNLVLRKPAG
jgi:SAM-dependent methyltransferase